MKLSTEVASRAIGLKLCTTCLLFGNVDILYVALAKLFYQCKILPKKGENGHFDPDFFCSGNTPLKVLVHG